MKVLIVTPQFERPEGHPMPNLPAWSSLWKMTEAEARSAGFACWKDNMFLLPEEWFDKIPADFMVECIDGDVSRWGAKSRDDDTRFGCLAYGFRAQGTT